MTTQLIPVFAGELSGAPTQLVDARLLHSFLEVGKDFSTWIKDRIKEYDFIENQDFLLPKFGEQNGSGGHNKIDYHLSIDMAKELGMIERNDKGRQIRLYFLEMERIAKTGSIAPTQKMLEMQNQLLDSQKSTITFLEDRLKQAQGMSDGMFSLFQQEEEKVRRLLRARGKVKPLERRDIFNKQEEGLEVTEIAKWMYRSTAFVKAVIKQGRYA